MLEQFLRFSAVGLASNAVGYMGYLLLTGIGVGPKVAMSSLYVIGVAQTFCFNRWWTFRHTGLPMPALIRYGVSYAAGYALNLGALYVFVDRSGLPHAWVQLVMVAVIAGFMFLLQRFWVFRGQSRTSTRMGPDLNA